MTIKQIIIFSILLNFSYSCSSSIIPPSESKYLNICQTNLNCNKKNTVECAVKLYLGSKNLFVDAQANLNKKLYLSAKTNLRKALCCLEKAKNKIKEAKLANYNDYKAIMDFKLETKVKSHISIYQSFLRRIRWK
tara:strand:- start:265 stop:669 length:405 start_codon:yes stop_codon:yes gene_type:complete